MICDYCKKDTWPPMLVVGPYVYPEPNPLREQGMLGEIRQHRATVCSKECAEAVRRIWEKDKDS